MHKYLLIAFLFTTSAGFAQKTYTIRGTVSDTAERHPLPHSTVCLLRAKDSILCTFAYGGDNGKFIMRGLQQGSYILLASIKGFADYTERFDLQNSDSTYDFGTIPMQLKAKLLQEVLIKGKVSAIRIKGDTTEFNAKAYVIQPNDKVEDLLRQLPGIQVDKDGKITANGRTVNNVLVDGEEFFGDDPTLVTQNIRADMVSKIQLYDKKSDQATFTGIDDGKKTKTINVVLKEDKKDGLFGKVNAGIGTNGYYDEQGMFNRFKRKEKYSAYITIANDGKLGLKFKDSNTLGASNATIGDNGLITLSGDNTGLDTFNGDYNNKGIPAVYSGGVHYDAKWNADKSSLNTNYKIGSIDVSGVTTSTAEEQLPHNLLGNSSNLHYENFAFRQRFDATYQVKLDTTSTLKIAVDATLKRFRVDELSNSQGRDSAAIINEQHRSVYNTGNQQSLSASAIYNKKFAKKRRTLSWSINELYNKNTTDGYLKAQTTFYNAGVADSNQYTDQYKRTNVRNSGLGSSVVYTEPITNRLSLVTSYRLEMTYSSANRSTFNKTPTGSYNALDSTYSDDYSFNQLFNQAGGQLNYKSASIMANVGAKVSILNFKQIDSYSDIAFHRNFFYLNPTANIEYTKSDDDHLSFSYSGNVNQPSINEIQPVPINIDPLYVIVGNPLLKPSYTHDFSASYSSANQTSGTNIDLFGSFGLTVHSIVDDVRTDPATGKSLISYTNLSGHHRSNYYGSANYSRHIGLLDASLQLSATSYGTISYSFVNGDISKAIYSFFSTTIGINKYLQGKYSFLATIGPSYKINEFNSGIGKNNAFGMVGNLTSTIYFPDKFQFAPSVRYLYTGATQTFDAQRRTIVNATLSKAFLKDSKLKLSFTVNDLLNQNVDFSRSISGNIVSQVNSTAIRRYCLLSVSWDFTKFKTISGK